MAPSEQLRLGGANSVRGYQEGEYLSDYGGTTTAEVFVPSYFFPPNWKLYKSKEPLRKQVQLVGFTDFGYGALHGTLVGEKRSRSLWGAGGGLRIHLYDKAYARLEWAAPLGGDHPTDHRRGAFYFGISMELI